MPTVLAASITRVCGGTWTARPSMVRLIRSGMGPPKVPEPLWGRLSTCGRLSIGPPPHSRGAGSGGNQPPRRLPTCPTMRSSYGHRAFTVLVGARFAVQVVLEFLPELLHDGDGRHGGGIAQGAEGAAQHVPRDIADQVDIGARALPVMETRQNLLQP